jgi:hypothetical protein
VGGGPVFLVERDPARPMPRPQTLSTPTRLKVNETVIQKVYFMHLPTLFMPRHLMSARLIASIELDIMGMPFSLVYMLSGAWIKSENSNLDNFVTDQIRPLRFLDRLVPTCVNRGRWMEMQNIRVQGIIISFIPAIFNSILNQLRFFYDMFLQFTLELYFMPSHSNYSCYCVYIHIYRIKMHGIIHIWSRTFYLTFLNRKVNVAGSIYSKKHVGGIPQLVRSDLKSVLLL